MFRGRHEHSIDAKGRTSLPARFREVLAARGESCVVITRSLDGAHLDAYGMREWDAFEAKLSENSQFDPRLDYVRREYVGNAVDCEVDKLGRLNLPGNLRSLAALEDAVLWLGVGKRIELWQPARLLTLHAAEQQKPENIADVKARLTELGL